MNYTGAEIIIKLLEKNGIDVVAGIPGGANLPLYDALYKSDITHILARHEQGAGFIAQGLARTTGKPAVCFATSGPGATNLFTAIADAKMDSVPIIAITGQVPTAFLGTDAFQEIDTYGMTLPITKHNFLIRDAKELLTVIPQAFKIAGEGRPGPVVIDIPKDVQLQSVEINESFDAVVANAPAAFSEIGKPDSAKITGAAAMINEAKRPVLYIGGGIIHAEASDMLYSLAKKNSLPVTATLMALGAYPADDALFIGMPGMHGARYTNYILKEADLLIAIGVRFDDRATGKVKEFCPDATIIHIDIDESEINKIKPSNISLAGDAAYILKELIDEVQEDTRDEWISKVTAMKAEYPLEMPATGDSFHPINIIKAIGDHADATTVITTDVGQHQMWTAQIYPFSKPRTLLTSGGLGTMGFGLPAAIGAALANNEQRTVCISGDGSFLMNIQELATLKELDLNITVIILNNGHLGLVRQQQELFYNANYSASKFDYNPDFTAIARGFGIESYEVMENDDPMDIIKQSFNSKGPCVINIPINYRENVMPMVPPGKANHEMIEGAKK